MFRCCQETADSDGPSRDGRIDQAPKDCLPPGTAGRPRRPRRLAGRPKGRHAPLHARGERGAKSRSCLSSWKRRSGLSRQRGSIHSTIKLGQRTIAYFRNLKSNLKRRDPEKLQGPMDLGGEYLCLSLVSSDVSVLPSNHRTERTIGYL